MNLVEARVRIRSRPELNAFISLSDEEGEGEVVAVKDLVDVAGMVTTAGGVTLPGVPASDDAEVIKALRRKGCLMVGKTNLHEFAYGVTSANPHYGPVRNPHDTSRVAGGSSGGSAVAVATGMCDWAVGSDTGGSIRIPASLCGVAGFKPSLGSVSTTGVFPLSPSLDTLGPMASDMRSCARAYVSMTAEEISIADLDDLTAPRLAVPAGWVTDLDASTGAAWGRLSAGIPEVEFPDRTRLFNSGLTILLVEAAAVHRRWATESPEKYGADVLGHIRRGLSISGVDYVEALREQAELQELVWRAMAQVDALLLPATAIVAPRLDEGTEVREPLTRFTRPFNTTGQPVAVLPAPVEPGGLPVGIQVVGSSNLGTLRAAIWLEREWQQAAD